MVSCFFFFFTFFNGRLTHMFLFDELILSEIFSASKEGIALKNREQREQHQLEGTNN